MIFFTLQSSIDGQSQTIHGVCADRRPQGGTRRNPLASSWQNLRKGRWTRWEAVCGTRVTRIWPDLWDEDTTNACNLCSERMRVIDANPAAVKYDDIARVGMFA